MSIKAKKSEKQSGKNKRKKRNRAMGRRGGKYNRGHDKKTEREHTKPFKTVFFSKDSNSSKNICVRIYLKYVRMCLYKNVTTRLHTQRHTQFIGLNFGCFC